MKSVQFYQSLVPLIASSVLPPALELGMGAVPDWSLTLGRNKLYIFIKTGKYPWESYRGGDFSVYPYLRPYDAPKPACNDPGMLKAFAYADDELKNEILRNNEEVYAKVRQIDVGMLPEAKNPEWADALKDLHSTSVEMLSWEIESDQPWVVINKQLFFLDEDDLSMWAPTIGKLFHQIVDAVDDGVVHEGI